MGHLFRFFGKYLSDDRWIVDDFELHHLKKVLRLRVGDRIEVFDGEGKTAQGNLHSLSSDEAIVVTSEMYEEKRATSPFIIGVGALKPATMDEILPALVELGVDEICIFLQKGTEKARINGKLQSRWKKILASAAKQAKRSWLPKISVASDIQEFEGNLQSSDDQLKILLSPGGRKTVAQISLTSSCIAVIGGECGLLPNEISFLVNRGFVEVKFCDTILRSKTAIVGLAAFVAACRAN